MHTPTSRLVRYTRIVCKTASITCSSEAGTQLLNLIARLGIPCRTVYWQDGGIAYREIMPSLLPEVAFALTLDLERYNLTGVIYDYSYGKYTGGKAPSLAWYTAQAANLSKVRPL